MRPPTHLEIFTYTVVVRKTGVRVCMIVIHVHFPHFSETMETTWNMQLWTVNCPLSHPSPFIPSFLYSFFLCWLCNNSNTSFKEDIGYHHTWGILNLSSIPHYAPSLLSLLSLPHSSLFFKRFPISLFSLWNKGHPIATTSTAVTWCCASREYPVSSFYSHVRPEFMCPYTW